MPERSTTLKRYPVISMLNTLLLESSDETVFHLTLLCTTPPRTSFVCTQSTVLSCSVGISLSFLCSSRSSWRFSQISAVLPIPIPETMSAPFSNFFRATCSFFWSPLVIFFAIWLFTKPDRLRLAANRRLGQSVWTR